MTQTLTERGRSKAVFDALPEHIRAQHQAAWSRCDAHIRSLVPKGAKVFEVHHAVEHGRRLYFAELAKGLPSDLCERAVMDAYKA